MSTDNLNRDALVVGICQYDTLRMSEELTKLSEQAEQLAQLLETQAGFKVKRLPCTPEMQIDLKETRVEIDDLEKAIEQLFYPPNQSPTDIALLFFAGHGLYKETRISKEGFLATSEADNKSIYGVSYQWLAKVLCNSPIKQQIVFIEACHSGAFFEAIEEEKKKGCFKNKDICFITSSRAHEEALTNGLLIQGLLNILQNSIIASNLLVEALKDFENNHKGWQRFQIEVRGKPIILINPRANELTLEPTFNYVVSNDNVVRESENKNNNVVGKLIENKSFLHRSWERFIKFVLNLLITIGLAISAGVVAMTLPYNPTVYEFEIKHQHCPKAENHRCSDITKGRLDKEPELFYSGDKYNLQFTAKERNYWFNTVMKYAVNKLKNEPPKDYENNYIYVFHLKEKEVFQLFSSPDKKDKVENIFNCKLVNKDIAGNLIKTGILYNMECDISCKENSSANEYIYFIPFSKEDEKKTLSVTNDSTLLDIYSKQSVILGYKIPPIKFKYIKKDCFS